MGTTRFYSKGSQSSDFRDKRSNRWCDRCQKPGHMKDICWKLHGKPPSSKGRGKPDNKALAISTDAKLGHDGRLSKEEAEFLRKILDKHDANVTFLASGNMAYPGLGGGEDDWCR